MKKLKNLYLTIVLKLKVRRAERLAWLYGYKYYVISDKNRFRLLSKLEAKKLIKQKYFRKGTTIQKIERSAVYVTHKQRK
jgi:hypothetical protein